MVIVVSTLYGPSLDKHLLLHKRMVYAVSYTHLDVYKRQVPSTAIISENRVRKREVVYVSDHSTVVKAEAISRKK